MPFPFPLILLYLLNSNSKTPKTSELSLILALPIISWTLISLSIMVLLCKIFKTHFDSLFSMAPLPLKA